MKIIKLTAENIMRLSAVEITPDGNVIVIGGKNGQGKSSVLSAIEMALGGKGKVVQQPVREGAERGLITIDLDEIVVQRSFTAAGGTKLTVKQKNGATFSSPQAMLDHLVGKLTFDPLAFARESPKRQADILRDLAGLDTSDLEAKRKQLYEARTEVNREASRLVAAAAEIPEPPEGYVIPATLPGTAGLMEELEAMEKRNAARQAKIKALESAEESADAQADLVGERIADVEKLEAELAKARESLDVARDRLEQLIANVEAARDDAEKAESELESVDDLKARIANYEQEAETCRQATERQKLRKAHEDKTAESKALTEQIEAVDAEKAKRIASAAFPIPGLSVTEESVTYNGLPFSQASSAEQLRASVAIGLALNPKLKVMIVRDGSLLDDESLELLSELAEEAGSQVWVERVSEGEEVSFVIEDGHVAGVVPAQVGAEEARA